MANRLRGEVGFDTSRGHLTLKYDVNALCELEDALDMGIPEFARSFANGEKMRLKHVRAAFWAGLRHHMPRISLADAGDVMMEIGGMAVALDLVGEAMSATFPKSDVTEESASEGPRTGRGSRTPGEDGVPLTSTRNASGGSPRAKSN